MIYDEKIISLVNLLEHFLRIVDPYELNHQGEYYGIQYRSGVYSTDENELILIKDYFNKIDTEAKFKIEILPLDNFYDAETYHQKYLDKNPGGYCHVNLSLIKNNERK